MHNIFKLAVNVKCKKEALVVFLCKVVLSVFTIIFFYLSSPCNEQIFILFICCFFLSKWVFFHHWVTQCKGSNYHFQISSLYWLWVELLKWHHSGYCSYVSAHPEEHQQHHSGQKEEIEFFFKLSNSARSNKVYLLFGDWDTLVQLNNLNCHCLLTLGPLYHAARQHS